MAKKYELTPEHRDQMKPWATRWIANAMSTKAMDDADRAAMREAVLGLYAAANLPAPKHIVFVPSPFVLRFAGGFAAAIWHLSKKGKPTRAATDAATDAATYDATYAATYDATRAATDAATHDATRDATKTDSGLLWFSFPTDGMVDLAKALGGAQAQFFLQCAGRAYAMWQGGNQWSAWDSFLSFFRHIAQLPLDYSKYQHWEAASVHGGPRIMHPDFCMVSDRPEILLVDDRDRPHCDTGPFCRWRDGSALYAIHGVRVPQWIVEQPQDITSAKIDAEQNAEIKRVMIERYPDGMEAYLRDAGAKPIDHDERWGTLYRKDLGDGSDPIMSVAVVNRSPEPDGSFKRYCLKVHPELRPLPTEANRFTEGAPQSLTARNAVASTFGMTGDQYERYLPSLSHES